MKHEKQSLCILTHIWGLVQNKADLFDAACATLLKSDINLPETKATLNHLYIILSKISLLF